MVHLEKDGASMDIALLGAEMRAYRSADGKDCLWSGNPDVWKSAAPVLFPAIGFLKNGTVTIAGKPCAIPKHGFAKFMTFTVTEQGDDFVILTLEQNAETKKIYPFDFALSVTHRFTKNGFETRYTVENHSSRAMPFVIGGHPGLTCPLNEGELFSDYIVHFEKAEEPVVTLCNADHLIDGTEPLDLGDDQRTLSLRYDDYDRIDTYVFPGLNSRSVDLVHKDTGHGMRFSFPEMEVLAIWTMPHAHAPYVCIEPWQGLPALQNESGRFEDKPYHIELQIGQTYSCGYRMELI